MKKIIFLSILFTVFSCKKADDVRLQNLPKREYIPQEIKEEKIEVPSYKIMEEKDISFRTGYNRSDPINKRFTYRVLVSPKIKRNQIEPLFNQLIKEFTSIDNDIDDITIWLYSDKNLINGIYDVAMATWAPEDGNVTGEIAVTNNRDSYKLNVTIPDNVEANLNPVKFDLSEAERKQIYFEIGDSQKKVQKELDKIYPNVNNINGEKYSDKSIELTKKYVEEINKKYKINFDTQESIRLEGFKKRWD